MTDKRITAEFVARIYDDRQGWYLQIGPDRDGSDIAEIRYSDGPELTANDPSIAAPWPHMVKLAEAILRLAPMNLPPETLS